MAEKSIMIYESDDGKRIAIRDGHETDESANARYIERVDFASGKFPTPIGTATRASVSSVDGVDLTSLPVGLTGNLLTVGDKSILCVGVEQLTSGGSATITPILFDNEASPGVVGILTSKTALQSTYNFRRGSGSGLYVLTVLVWDLIGAYKVGLHISAITGTSNEITLYGWVI